MNEQIERRERQLAHVRSRVVRIMHANMELRDELEKVESWYRRELKKALTPGRDPLRRQTLLTDKDLFEMHCKTITKSSLNEIIEAWHIMECPTHGPSESFRTINHDVYCRKCVVDAIRSWVKGNSEKSITSHHLSDLFRQSWPPSVLTHIKEIIECPDCEGIGEIAAGDDPLHMLDCERCDGEGKIVYPDNWEE